MKYHDKKYRIAKLFRMNETQEGRLYKEAIKRKLSQSEVIRRLIDTLK